ncbi:hypothetical protein BSKO_03920 [Bryopsis sp. KO-2023]|nr:hypothetical protein BSKO_03920 [Bryopsis sp. KO-2023]
MTSESSVRVLFRHQAGDLGPLSLPQTTTIGQVKEQVLKELPSETLRLDPPGSASDIILIMSGKYADDGKTLENYRLDHGESKPDQTLVMHLVIRPNSSAQGGGKIAEPMKCCCSIQ